MKLLFIILGVLAGLFSAAQERIFSIGYAKNYVDADSSNFSLQIDFNRIPGKTENPGTFYLLNTSLSGSRFGAYIKPMADVNVGSFTTIAPNNISIGLPIGTAYDFVKSYISPGTLTAAFELSPELVSDKSLDQYLYYLSTAAVFNYSVVPNPSHMLLDIASGLYLAHGRRMVDVKSKTKNSYGRISVPMYVGGSFFRNSGGGFFHLKFSGTYKYYNVYRDNSTTTPDATMDFSSLRADYFFIKNLGINLSYNYGYDEPLFKKVNSLSFGFTLAR